MYDGVDGDGWGNMDVYFLCLLIDFNGIYWHVVTTYVRGEVMFHLFNYINSLAV